MSKLFKHFGFLFVLIAMLGAIGKGKAKPKKEECGGRDADGNKKKNELVREATKEQAKNPDPNAPAK